MKSFQSPEDDLLLRPIFGNRGFFQSVTFLNQHFSERITIIQRLTDFESKLSDPTSALPECRSEDPDDLVLNPVKNSIPFPFVQSSLLSLV
jgi:hypothetical protein